MPRRSPLLATSLASLLAATAACTLDPAGSLPPGGDGGAGPATTTGPGPGSTGSTTTASTGSTSTGDGGGTTGTSGGEGGGGSTGGAGGTGDGGAGGAGGSGGGGPLDEWLTRVTGPDVQRVRDVVVDEAGGAIYVVGLVKGNVVALDGLEETADAEGEDAFAARLDLDGTPVWLQVFGGSGADQARGVALGDDGRLFVSGFASNADAAAGDLFAPGLETPPESPWGWLVELDPSSGVAIDGVPFGPVDPGDGIDVTVTTTAAVAMATCSTSCADAVGRDVVAAEIDRMSGESRTTSFHDAGDQRVGAIAAVPASETIVVTGRFTGGTLDPKFGGELTCSLLVGPGGEDVFVAAYDLAGEAPSCVWAHSLSGTGNDRADGLFVNAEGTAYVAARFAAAPITFSDDVGPHVVQVTPLVIGWATPLETGEAAGEALSVAGDGATILVGGRLDATDDGYVVRLGAADGAEVGKRVFTPGTSRTRAVAVDGEVRIAVGELDATTDFLGDVGPIDEDAVDGFVLRLASP